MEMQLDKLPKWALPVGAGALLGVGVLLTRGNKGTTVAAPIAVGGQTGGNTEQGADMILNRVMEQFTSLMASNNESILDVIASNSSASQSNNQAIMDLIRSVQDNFTDLVQEITQLPTDTQSPITQYITIIDQYREKFRSAFERVVSPAGEKVLNSDITQGILTNPMYQSDTGFTYYETSGHYVTGPFRQFLGNFGGARTWGRPLSQVFRDTDGFDTQLFENTIMKFIPGSNSSTYDIVTIPLN